MLSTDNQHFKRLNKIAELNNKSMDSFSHVKVTANFVCGKIFHSLTRQKIIKFFRD
jgi:hypothetical protein